MENYRIICKKKLRAKCLTIKVGFSNFAQKKEVFV